MAKTGRKGQKNYGQAADYCQAQGALEARLAAQPSAQGEPPADADGLLDLTNAHKILDAAGIECGPSSAEPRSVSYRLGLLLERVEAAPGEKEAVGTINVPSNPHPEITEAVRKVVAEYGPVLERLGTEEAPKQPCCGSTLGINVHYDWCPKLAANESHVTSSSPTAPLAVGQGEE